MSDSETQRLRPLVGKYIQQHAEPVDEERAQGLLGGALNRWKETMWDREGVMSRHDGSDLRNDELRLPKLPRGQRSDATRDDPLIHVSPSDIANHAILTFHNLMRGFDSMVVSDARDEMRLHLSAEYVMIRALIEAACTAVWVLGPDESDERITRSMRLRRNELAFAKRLTKVYNEQAELVDDDATAAQMAFVNGQLQDLKVMARTAGRSWSAVEKNLSPSDIVLGAGEYVADLGPAMTFWYWSTASSIAHAELGNMHQLADMRFIGVDVRDAPIVNAEPSAASIWKHFEAVLHMINSAHALWNKRAGERPA